MGRGLRGRRRGRRSPESQRGGGGSGSTRRGRRAGRAGAGLSRRSFPFRARPPHPSRLPLAARGQRQPANRHGGGPRRRSAVRGQAQPRAGGTAFPRKVLADPREVSPQGLSSSLSLPGGQQGQPRACMGEKVYGWGAWRGADAWGGGGRRPWVVVNRLAPEHRLPAGLGAHLYPVGVSGRGVIQVWMDHTG